MWEYEVILLISEQKVTVKHWFYLGIHNTYCPFSALLTMQHCSLWPFTFRSQQSDYIVLGWFHSFIDHQRKLYTNCSEKNYTLFNIFGPAYSSRPALVQSSYIHYSTRSFRVPSRSSKDRTAENSKIFLLYCNLKIIDAMRSDDTNVFLYIQTLLLLGQIFK